MCWLELRADTRKGKTFFFLGCCGCKSVVIGVMVLFSCIRKSRSYGIVALG